MLVGLNAGFGLPLTSDWPFIQAAGCAVVRQEFSPRSTTRRCVVDGGCRLAAIRSLALLGGGEEPEVGRRPDRTARVRGPRWAGGDGRSLPRA